MLSRNPINFDFAQSPALGDGVAEVAEMKFGSEFHFRNFFSGDWLNTSAVVWLWRLAVVAVATAQIMLISAGLDDINTILGLVLFFAFALAGVASATSKADERATAFAQRIMASVHGAIKTIIRMSTVIVAIMASIPSFFVPIERRSNPPKKIHAPTLYPRLASTPWLVRA